VKATLARADLAAGPIEHERASPSDQQQVERRQPELGEARGRREVRPEVVELGEVRLQVLEQRVIAYAREPREAALGRRDDRPGVRVLERDLHVRAVSISERDLLEPVVGERPEQPREGRDLGGAHRGVEPDPRLPQRVSHEPPPPVPLHRAAPHVERRVQHEVHEQRRLPGLGARREQPLPGCRRQRGGEAVHRRVADVEDEVRRAQRLGRERREDLRGLFDRVEDRGVVARVGVGASDGLERRAGRVKRQELLFEQPRGAELRRNRGEDVEPAFHWPA
jgi:hypothetical protein